MFKWFINWRIVWEMEMKEVWEHKVLNFSIVSKNKFKNKETDEYDWSFISCSCWNKTAETIDKFFNSKDWIILEWDVVQQNWEQDWWKRSKHVFQISWFEFPICKKWNTEETEEDESF